MPLIEVCNRLVRYDVGLIPPETRLYFRDIYDHVVASIEMIESYRDLLSALVGRPADDAISVDHNARNRAASLLPQIALKAS